MKKVLFLFLSLFAVVPMVSSQGIKSILDNDINPGKVLVEFDNRTIDVKGTYYLDEDWSNGDILLKSGILIKNQVIRYDLEYDMLEIKIPDQIKIIPLRKLESYILFEEPDANLLFVNCERYSFEDGTPLSGICQVLDTGYYGGIIKFTCNLKEADYIPALDMGSKSHEIVLTSHIFLTKDKTIFKIPVKKKNFYNFYINPKVDIKLYMKKNKLNHRKPEDLAKVLHFINQPAEK